MFYTELTSCRSPTNRGQQTQLHCSNLKAERVEQQLLHRKHQYLIHFKDIYRIFLNSNQKGMEDDGSDEYSKFISTMRSAKTRISAAEQQNEPTRALSLLQGLISNRQIRVSIKRRRRPAGVKQQTAPPKKTETQKKQRAQRPTKHPNPTEKGRSLNQREGGPQEKEQKTSRKMKGPRPPDPVRPHTRTPAPTQKDQMSPPKTNKKETYETNPNYHQFP